MDSKRAIIVNDIAATSAGAYTILKNFLEELSQTKKSLAFNWIVFVSCEEFLKYNSGHIRVINIKSKSWFTRIYWDLIGMRKWLKRNKVSVYRLFSIQNTGIPFMNVSQFIYLHQPLILARDIKLKSFEWKIKLFRYIYFYCVKWTIKKASKIIVQTEWMKKETIRQLKVKKENVLIIKPRLNIKFNAPSENKDGVTYKLFYPAVPVVSYKNHELIIKALFELKKLNFELYRKLEVIFTVEKEFNKVTSYYYSLSKKLGVKSQINWCGYLNQSQMNENYHHCDIFLFPSRLESFGLPLIEAAYANSTIFSLDTSFSKELLKSYERVKYIENNPQKWAEAISNFYKNYGQLNKGNVSNVEFKQDRSVVETLID